MPLTNAEKQARHRDRLKAKLKRLAVLEAALREIASDQPDAAGCNPQLMRDIARQALAS